MRDMFRAYFTRWKVVDLLAMGVFIMAFSRFISYFRGTASPWFGYGRPMAFSTSICLMFIAICLVMISAYMEE